MTFAIASYLIAHPRAVPGHDAGLPASAPGTYDGVAIPGAALPRPTQDATLRRSDEAARRRRVETRPGSVEVDQLRAFLAVVDHGSVLVAATATGLPRSTVRAKLDALEAALGARLFARTQQGAVPTAAGLALVGEARALLNRVDGLPALLQAATGEAVGSLHLRTPVGLPPELLAFLASEIRRRHPSLLLRASLAEDPVQRIPEDVDLVIHFGPALPRGPYRTSVIARLPEHLLASPDYLAAHGRPETVEDLAKHTLLSWRPPGESGRVWPTRDGRAIDVSPVLVSPDIHQVRVLVSMGMGIALLPDAPFPTASTPDGLVRVLEDVVGRECAFRLVVPEGRVNHPRVRAALRIVQELFEGSLGLHLEPPEP